MEKDPIRKLADLIYTAGSRKGLFKAVTVRQNLKKLNTAAEEDKLLRAYYVQKIRLTLVILLVGVLFFLLLAIKASKDSRMKEQGVLIRNPPGSGRYSIELQAKGEQINGTYRLEIDERKLGTSEAEALCEEFLPQLEEAVLGKNSSWQAISQDIHPVQELEGYPFWVEWDISDNSRMSSTGAVTAGLAEEEILVTANISYGSFFRTVVFTGKIPASDLSMEERRYLLLDQQLGELSKDMENRQLILPAQVEGSPITWQEVGDHKSPAILVLAIAAAISVYFLQDKDLSAKVRERKDRMASAYPLILNKMTMYLGAGMTIRGAMFRMVSAYEKSKQEKGENPAYEELYYTCNEMQSGEAEDKAYERFAARTGLQEYARFSTLLTQNLKKGNGALLLRLTQEGQKAMQEEMNRKKKRGEEASTRLLVPMIMMLGMVMILVMLPSFYQMGM